MKHWGKTAWKTRAGGVSDRDQGQWEGRGGKMIEVKCVLNNQQFIVYKGNSNL